MTLRPGARVISAPLKPALVFVHAEDHRFVGWFRQNSLLRLQTGNDAEVAFDAIPGKVFAGTVETVFAAMAEGQLLMNGTLVKPDANPGRIPVAIQITDPAFEAFAERIPGGVYGQAAIYTEHVEAVAIMRKILLRMSSWMNYLFPIH
jgi:multidrug resistance efflux pump